MTKSEELAEHWYLQEFGIQLERNGWPDCWNIEPDGRLLAIEIKYNNSDLTEQQLFIRNLLIKNGGIHYQLVHVSKDYKDIKIVFDSDKHKI